MHAWPCPYTSVQNGSLPRTPSHLQNTNNYDQCQVIEIILARQTEKQKQYPTVPNECSKSIVLKLVAERFIYTFTDADCKPVNLLSASQPLASTSC